MRPQVSIDDIKEALLARLDAVIGQYAPPATGSHTTHGRYFTLNPGRADRRVGSFCITLSGPKAGRWNDYASAEHGDVLDLIGLSCNLDAKGAVREARAFLGLDRETPELTRQREAAALRAKKNREADEVKRAAQDAHKQNWARGLWFGAQEQIIGTPVDQYLTARAIELSRLPHLPGAIRYAPECRYYYTEEVVDPDTGEVAVWPNGRPRTVSKWRPMPAMVTAITRGKAIIDCHRTYLAFDADRGIWAKAPVPDAKKVFSDYTGGAIRLSGQVGPKGGHLRLNQAPQGSRCFIAEGIENALSLIAMRQMAGLPPAFVIAAGAVFNMGVADLPATISEVVLAADNDAGDAARAQITRAVATHRAAGRKVGVWRSETPGEDLNDALRRAIAEQTAMDMAEEGAE